MRRIYELRSTQNADEYIRIPVNPPKFEFTEAQLNQKITLLNLGEANQLGGKGLAALSFSSFFPSSISPFFKHAEKNPEEYISLLKKWKDNAIPIRVIITESNINIVMIINRLVYYKNEGDRDIYYTLDFDEYRSLNVPSVKVNTTVKKAIVRPAPQSPKTKVKQAASSKKQVTYTTKGNDTLWGIAVKYYGNGSKYTQIYNANKNLIESTAKKHGFASSDKGHWIWGGMKLVIP